jgi:hypothetical protein
VADVWIAGSIAGAVGLLVVLAALLLDLATEEAGRASALGRGLPRPREVRRLRLPTTTWGGYDRRAVDAEIAALADRYEALYLAAGPSVIAAAERRLEPAPASEDAAAPEGEVS